MDYSDSLTAWRPGLDSGLPDLRMCAADSVACFLYPPNEYRGYNFSWASFSARILKGFDKESKCFATVDSNECREHGSELHNGVTFHVSDCREGGLGNLLESHVYSVYRRGVCYQLRISLATTNWKNYDPGSVKEFSPGAREQVLRTLRRSLESFQFRK